MDKIEVDYNLDNLLDLKESTPVPVTDLDPFNHKDFRPNLRIVKCCANCKHMVYKRGQERRGFCRLPDAKKHKRSSAAHAEKLKTWPRVHVTLICDNHKLRSIARNITRINDWVGVKFSDVDGTKEVD